MVAGAEWRRGRVGAPSSLAWGPEPAYNEARRGVVRMYVGVGPFGLNTPRHSSVLHVVENAG